MSCASNPAVSGGLTSSTSPVSGIHLWFAFPDSLEDKSLLEAYERLMSVEERQRHRRFCFEKDRHLFLVSRALMRTMLSRFTGVEPEHLQFSKNRYGRPEISNPDAPPVRFNLSHTRGLVVCAVAWKNDIGVDVEDMERKGASLKIADRFFSTPEVEALNDTPETARRSRFFDYWTLKEAYIKARGMGLAIPLNQFSFHLSQRNRIHVSFHSAMDETPSRWRFWTFRPTDRHKAALAVCQESLENPVVSIKQVVPGVREKAFHCPVAAYSHADEMGRDS